MAMSPGRLWSMEFARVRLTDPEVEPLLTDLRREYELRYGPDNDLDDLSAHEFDPPAGAFVVLRDDGKTIAGGGIRRLDDETCEFKRMWTNPLSRRQGHATALVRELEALAGELGYTRVRLETGPAQPEALALYPRLGYREIHNYGKYENATGFERSLTAHDS